MNNLKVAVLGGGSWATALVKVLSNTISKKKGFNWYIRDKKVIRHLLNYQHNPNYLSSLTINPKEHNIIFYDNIEEVIKDSDILIFVIPSAYITSAMSNLSVSLHNKYIVSAVKGIIPKENLIVGEYFHKVHHVPMRSIAVVSGPSHAEEVALERLSFLTIASRRISFAQNLAVYFDCRFIQTRVSRDIYGIEYAAVLKNIYALAAGICHGAGYGDNFQAVLISNAMQELRRFVKTVKPVKNERQAKSILNRFMKRVNPFVRNLNTSAYLGDLLVTSYSQFSRNRTFGTMIGKGYSVSSAKLEMNMVAEGYFATKCIVEINKNFGVKIPIVEMVYDILYEEKEPKKTIRELSLKLK